MCAWSCGRMRSTREAGGDGRLMQGANRIGSDFNWKSRYETTQVGAASRRRCHQLECVASRSDVPAEILSKPYVPCTAGPHHPRPIRAPTWRRWAHTAATPATSASTRTASRARGPSSTLRPVPSASVQNRRRWQAAGPSQTRLGGGALWLRAKRFRFQNCFPPPHSLSTRGPSGSARSEPAVDSYQPIALSGCGNV